MLCPKCNYNQKYKHGLQCYSCKYVFIFDPKTDGFADGRFQKIVEKISENNTVYFTKNQLYAYTKNYKCCYKR